MAYNWLMSLKNAFDGLATEGTLKRLISMLGFARDGQDRLRIIVEGTATTALYARNTTTNMSGSDSQIHYSSSTWNAIDARDPYRMQMTQRSDFIKTNRWTY